MITRPFQKKMFYIIQHKNQTKRKNKFNKKKNYKNKLKNLLKDERSANIAFFVSQKQTKYKRYKQYMNELGYIYICIYKSVFQIQNNYFSFIFWFVRNKII